ncbi:hypothetical protein JCM19294_1155 [Nonlabens tegetincola]|uniref:Uncharacterized protein n=1 Tax=Nonlabens tegetincola TaxID=323273 RepID=A0A090QMU0_9FLAO|nr:hypothetical protein [Nonlabens tegetincola]GAK96846.1 hypothetical protein JCM19294_1155 [Nonlabens tegetincola]
MEQIQELFEILKSTPEMALWGLLIWCIYILAKLASVVYAVKIVFQLAINKIHDYKIKKLNLTNKEEIDDARKKLLQRERDIITSESSLSDLKRLANQFEKASISSVDLQDWTELIQTIRSTSYVHRSDIQEATRVLKNHKNKLNKS